MEKAEIKAIGDYLKDLEELRKIAKMKRCRKCGKWKAESKFYKQSRHKDGSANRCKECADKDTNKARKRRLAVRS